MIYEIYIGIDAGVHTGFAVYDTKSKRLIKIVTIKIHEAMFLILNYKQEYPRLKVIVEDARLRTWYGNDKGDRAKSQGVGSVKRDCQIWDDFLRDTNIPYEMKHPKRNKTKLDAAPFKKITGWTERTNEHGRDAAMLVFGL